MFSYQQFVQIAAEIVDDVEQELVGGIRKNLAECCQSPCEMQTLRIALVGNDKYQNAGDDWGDNQCIQSCSAEGCRNCTRSSGYLYNKAADGDIFEFFVAIEQCSGYDGGGGEE